MAEADQKQLVDFQNIINKDGYYFTAKVQGTSAATSGNYGIFATVRYPIQILRVVERHEVIGSDAGAVTLDVVIVDNGSAISTGTSILASTFDLKGTANTLQIKEKRTLSSTRLVEPNQSLALETSGTLTAVAGVSVTVYYQPYSRGSYK